MNKNENLAPYFTIQPKLNLIPEKGHLLISEPFMEDRNFKRTVLLLCAHNDVGSFALILNKPLEISLGEVVPDLADFDANLYYGGPVQANETLHYLHAYGDIIEDSVQIYEDLYWGGDFEQLKSHISIGIINPNKVRFYVGYAGWEAEQLDNEMKQKSWVVTKGKSSDVFSDLDSSMQLWRSVLRDFGSGEYRVLSHLPENPSEN
ncbi:MAG: YqgE/AlgH family protein [Chitinophagales bacterium]